MLYLNKQKTCPSFTLFIEYEKKTNKTYLYEVVYECPQEDNDLSQPAKSSLPKNSVYSSMLELQIYCRKASKSCDANNL